MQKLDDGRSLLGQDEVKDLAKKAGVVPAKMKNSTMRCRVERYLERRRNLGYTAPNEAGYLRSFARFAEEEGHNTTHGYIEADLAMKEKALSAVKDPKNQTGRFRPPKDLLAFLDAL